MYEVHTNVYNSLVSVAFKFTTVAKSSRINTTDTAPSDQTYQRMKKETPNWLMSRPEAELKQFITV